MSDYYYNHSDRQRKQRSIFSVLFDLIMLVISIVAFVVICITLVTSYYDPSISWIFPVFGLITPAIYIATSLLALYWIIRWRWLHAAMLLTPLLIGAPSISRYLNIETEKHYEELPKRGVVRLISYNVRGLIGDDKQASTTDLKEFIEEQRPDILCIQEFASARMKEEEEPEAIKNFYRAKLRELAIFSRYKILDSSEDLVHAEYQSGSGMWADLLIGSDTVRMYNIHLHSTAITNRDNDYINNMEFLSDSLNNVRGMLSRFRDTSIGRASQADSIAYSIAQTPHRVVVCGDFNDTPNSYSYRVISKELKDSFQEAGKGYSYTYRGFLNLLRIDYIFVDQNTEVLSYEVVDSMLISDHLPVIATLKF